MSRSVSDAVWLSGKCSDHQDTGHGEAFGAVHTGVVALVAIALAIIRVGKWNLGRGERIHPRQPFLSRRYSGSCPDEVGA